MDVQTDETVPNVIVRADIPDTVTYADGSTEVNGVPTSVDSITGGGLALGSLSGGHNVTFVLSVKGSSVLVAGTLESTITTHADGDGTSSVTDSVSITIDNTGSAGGAATTPTGPAEVTTLALLVAALLSLLYVSYTHTGAYRSREVDSITKRRDPLDFQN
jgi:hypothetical protein